jgi:hypothetical protein
MAEKCAIAGCSGNVDCPTMGICKACYSSMYYWSRKKPKEMLVRAQNLTKYEARMNIMMPAKIVYEKPPMTTLTVLPGANKRYKKKKKALRSKTKLRIVA